MTHGPQSRRRLPLPRAQDLFAGDFGVPVGGALLGVSVDRAQQRIDVDERRAKRGDTQFAGFMAQAQAYMEKKKTGQEEAMTREELLKIKERLEGGVNSSDPTENAVVMHALLESHLAALEQVEKLKKMAKRPRSLRTPKTEAEWERWLQGRTR